MSQACEEGRLGTRADLPGGHSTSIISGSQGNHPTHFLAPASEGSITGDTHLPILRPHSSHNSFHKYLLSADSIVGTLWQAANKIIRALASELTFWKKKKKR